MKIAIIAYNAHKNCAEGVARIHYNLYSSLRRIGVEVNLISLRLTTCAKLTLDTKPTSS
ncbi:MAG: hypothetical protein QXF79_07310 [Ignisphaera sp.]